MFDPETQNAALQHAKEVFPQESCGIISKGVYHPMENKAADPLENFEIDPALYLDFVNGEGVEAVMHSHPNGPDCPTKNDMEGQEACAVPWGIIPFVMGQPRRPFFWGDQLPIAPLLERSFRMGVFDCYSLARDWYRLNWGLVLPVWPRDPDWWTKGESVIADGLEAMGFVRVEEPLQVGDGFVGKIAGDLDHHCAVYVGDGLILHHLPNRLSMREPLNNWKRRLPKIYRHRSKL